MPSREQLRKPAFTLIELLVVVAIIALLISILLPALHKVRENAKSVKCLVNLRTLGQGVVSYAGEEGRLPGPIHPALYRNQGLNSLMTNPVRPLGQASAEYFQSRQLTWKLRGSFNDSHDYEGSITDQVATCPLTVGLNPDSNFLGFYNATNRFVYPTSYVINNVGTTGADSGSTGGMRTTDPPQYFGFSPWSQTDPTLQSIAAQYPPQPISRVKKPSDEWMIADAWYRMRSNAAFQELQQEGPYQWDWTGEALPNFAPHFAGRQYAFPGSSALRDGESAEIRKSRGDGKTNTVYFDGHATAVRSKRLIAGANGAEILYGFPGTVNPFKQQPGPNHAIWSAYWE